MPDDFMNNMTGSKPESNPGQNLPPQQDLNNSSLPDSTVGSVQTSLTNPDQNRSSVQAPGASASLPGETATLSATPQKSPLEESAGPAAIAPTTPSQLETLKPEPVVPDEGENPAVSNQQESAGVDAVSDRELATAPTAAPDTDEFLKSILNPTTPVNSATPVTSIAPEVPQTNPSEPITPPEPTPASGLISQEQPPDFSPMPSSSIMGEREPSQIEPSQITPVPPETDNKIKDSINNLDSIVSPQTNNPEGIGQPAAPDVISAMQKNPSQKPRSGKLVILFVAAVIIAIAGYVVYSMIFGKTTTPTSTLTTVSKTVVSLTNDQLRKQDIGKLQDALLNFAAGSGGTYPVSDTLTLLSTSGNILEKELVPTYLDKIPVDPDATKNYAYKSDGKTFVVSAVLDDKTDSDAVIQNSLAIYQLTQNKAAATTTTSATATATATTSFTPTVIDSGATSTSNELPF